MRKIVLTAVVVALITGAVVWAQSTVEEQTRGEPSWARLVSVVNWPASQTVDGEVNVGNLPPVQDVSGSVEVTNLPAVEQVTGTVEVANQPTGPPRFEFVGVTTARFDGSGDGGGWIEMTRACAAEFAGSRMAFSDELMALVDPVGSKY